MASVFYFFADEVDGHVGFFHEVKLRDVPDSAVQPDVPA